MSGRAPILEARSLSKRFGRVVALEEASLAVHAGEVTCLAGDNGAGKSTLIKILSGAHVPTSGALLLDGVPVSFASPREALARGVAAVYQDLAMVPLMSIWRNVHLGAEPTRGWGPLTRIDVARCRREAVEAVAAVGIDVPDPDAAVVSLSGGERQAVAIARALHRGARVLILDEPTAALGVRQSTLLLDTVRRAAGRGAAVVLVTHNPAHAYSLADHFVVLRRGRVIAAHAKDDLSVDSPRELMSG